MPANPQLSPITKWDCQNRMTCLTQAVRAKGIVNGPTDHSERLNCTGCHRYTHDSELSDVLNYVHARRVERPIKLSLKGMHGRLEANETKPKIPAFFSRKSRTEMENMLARKRFKSEERKTINAASWLRRRKRDMDINSKMKNFLKENGITFSQGEWKNERGIFYGKTALKAVFNLATDPLMSNHGAAELLKSIGCLGQAKDFTGENLPVFPREIGNRIRCNGDFIAAESTGLLVISIE